MPIYDILNFNIINKIIDTAEESDKFLIIKFGSINCPPCRSIKQKYLDLSEKYINNVVFTSIDVDEQPEITDKFSITSLPTFVIIKNRNIVKKIIGADLNSIINFINQ
jgi:thioredoxin 1